MNLQLSHPSGQFQSHINVTGSKSESNRLLILQALFPQISIQNLSNSDDTKVLQKALWSKEEIIDIHHAGTAMRFLTSYFAAKEGREVVLTGSTRMQERPVKILVEALRELGAEIEYLKNEGFPPIKIKGKKLPGKEVKVQANISSQYISSLMLTAPALQEGLKIHLEGKVTSVPYIEMTLNLMRECGLQGNFDGECISVLPMNEISPVEVTVESDWSSASYFYSMVALSTGSTEVVLNSYNEESHQGDKVISTIFDSLGVKTTFSEGSILLRKEGPIEVSTVELELSNSPDLAQTIAVTCLGLGLSCTLTGLHTLRIKETDRLQALKNEIEKLGGKVELTQDSLRLSASAGLKSNTTIATYNDHRMALAFAPLALKIPLEIEDAEVVSKSFPGFWEDLQKMGFSVEKTEVE